MRMQVAEYLARLSRSARLRFPAWELTGHRPIPGQRSRQLDARSRFGPRSGTGKRQSPFPDGQAPDISGAESSTRYVPCLCNDDQNLGGGLHVSRLPFYVSPGIEKSPVL